MTKKWQTVPDAQVRHLAETTFDRNIVVVAGAGTGKTTLLVNRLVHLLMREPQPVEITKLVALTFTNKAAAEMKLRLRDRLSSLLHAEAAEPDGCGDPGAVTAADLRERYDVSNAQIVARADAALHGLDKAQIGTLHSFAAHLLRLYPLESGVDPNFRTDDDESRFQDHFAAQWDLWLDRELALPGPQEARWRRLLSVRGLDSLREMAYALRSELIPLDELQRQAASGALPPALRDWFAAKRDRASTLLASRSQAKRLKADAMLDATQALFGLLLEHGVEGLAKLSAEQRQVLDKDVGKKTAGWNEADFAEAEGLIATAQQVCAVDGALTADLLALLCPFVQEVRATFLAQGWVSFDGLLARARALLRGQPGIRERLKHEYQAVLVDEFQDTDPVQYEIVLYLAEQAGRQGDDWRAIELEPGKLFIVGDPKQSIYAFRRADIEAFERVVEKVAASGGIIYPLSTNFRSDARVLEVVNPLFDRLLVRQDHVQPANVPLIVRPNRPSRIGLPGVEVRAVTAGDDEETTSQSVTRQEADQLARWLKDELLAQETLVDAAGRKDRLKPGHVALLFRKLTQAQEYLDALRRHEIAYITDGEKHFYRRQEVVDLINVLRVVENPHDTIALVGVLRSPLGGVTDRELVALRERGGFDYRQAARLSDWKSPCAEAVRLLYARLAGLHRSLSTVPLPEAVDRLFDSLPILELAAASLHGEQAVANLMKVRQMAVELAGRPHLTLTAFVELMIARLDEQPEEAESALAEESLDAVRVLTIHKAKGLEFPVVVLPGLHHGTRRGRDAPSVSHDWTTGVFGINWGDRCNLGAVMVNEKVRLREAAEQRRLFYVGMTRAQERLVLSGGWRGSSSRSEWTFFDLLQEAATGEIGGADASTLRIGPVPLRQTVVMTAERSPGRRKPAPVRLRASKEWDSVAERWKARDQAWNIVRATPAHVTPTGLLTAKGGGAGPVARPAGDAGRARLVGTLAHRVLQHWDFALPPDGLQERIAALCRTGFPLGLPEDVRAVEEELRDLFAAFTASEAYRDLCRAEILGREVPFAMSWEGNRLWAMGYGAGKVQADSSLSPIAYRPLPASCVMEGVIDMIYRLDGQVHLADYKTDRVQDGELSARAAGYEGQVRIYREAVARCLGLDRVGVQLFFLRNGKTVSM